MSKKNDDFQYNIYEKFTELFVSQKSIGDSLKNFNSTVENLSTCVSKLHLRVDQMEKVIIKQSALISASAKVAYITFIALSIGSALMFNEVFHGVSDVVKKFFEI
jgi:hypothetical protein